MQKQRIVSTKHLHDYVKKYPETESHITSWLNEFEAAIWKTPHDVKQKYANASIVGNRRIVFNIQGNHHRLIIAMAYNFGVAYVKFIGTHAEYDEINAATVEMEN